jgi:hypothetical protein
LPRALSALPQEASSTGVTTRFEKKLFMQRLFKKTLQLPIKLIVFLQRELTLPQSGTTFQDKDKTWSILNSNPIFDKNFIDKRFNTQTITESDKIEIL